MVTKLCWHKGAFKGYYVITAGYSTTADCFCDNARSAAEFILNYYFVFIKFINSIGIAYNTLRGNTRYKTNLLAPLTALAGDIFVCKLYSRRLRAGGIGKTLEIFRLS